jgi:hypothetical protein
MTKIAGSASGSISQRNGSADPDPDPDPPQNVMDPQHWKELFMALYNADRNVNLGKVPLLAYSVCRP